MGCSTHQTALQGQPQANKPLQCQHPHTKPPEAQPEEEKLQCRHSPEWKPVAAGQFHFPILGPRCSDTTRATSWWVCGTRRAVGRQTCSWEGLGEGGRHCGEGWAHRVHHVAGGDHPAVAGGGVCCGWQGMAGSPEGLHRRPEPTSQNLLQHRLHPPGPGAAGRGRGGKAQLPVLRGHWTQNCPVLLADVPFSLLLPRSLQALTQSISCDKHLAVAYFQRGNIFYKRHK